MVAGAGGTEERPVSAAQEADAAPDAPPVTSDVTSAAPASPWLAPVPTQPDEPADQPSPPLPTGPLGASPDPQAANAPRAVGCPTPTRLVGSAAELTEALAAARPGDAITLADGVYVGRFVATVSGTSKQPISLCAGTGAVLDGDGIRGGYVLHLDRADHWRILGMTVRNGQKGIMLDGSTGSVIQGVTVEDIGDEGIHLRSASTDNQVIDNVIRRTGLRRQKFGEGVYVGSAVSNWCKYTDCLPDRSDRNLVRGNTISLPRRKPSISRKAPPGGGSWGTRSTARR